MSATRLALRTALGTVYRDVLPNEPRDCTREEIPIIDAAPIFSEDLEERKKVARELRTAAVSMGFFYLENHGIAGEVIDNCRQQTLAFFKQPVEKKELAGRHLSRFYNGYFAARSTNVNPLEGIDVKESFAFRYEPQYDAPPKDPTAVPRGLRPYIRGEQFVWDGTAHLPGFKDGVLAYWQACLMLARRLVRIFALSLDLPEDYWDDKVTHPGADAAFNYYPPRTRQEVEARSVSLGSHTDLQLFTLLWQDSAGGLQVLSPEGQWLKAPPVEGTLVVNIGDFMMRLCNDIYKSNVHRVYNESLKERVSLPFFFGLNFNCVEGVVPTCASAENPAKYKPICCGDWCELRFKAESEEFKKKSEEVLRDIAPSAVVVKN